MKQTTFDTKISILAMVWTHYRNDEAWKEIVQHFATGFAFAYGLFVEYFAIQEWEGALEDVKDEINKSFGALLTSLELKDTGFTDWDDFLEKANA